MLSCPANAEQLKGLVRDRKNMLNNYEAFITGILQKITTLGIDVSQMEMDHVGYQAASEENYDTLKSEFTMLGEQVSEEIVGGRRVGIYALEHPITVLHYMPTAIELIAPKVGQVCPSALEHVEFVLPESFEAFMKRYPNLPWDTTAIAQPDFPMIKLKLTATTQVKFHHQPVLEIVKEIKKRTTSTPE